MAHHSAVARSFSLAELMIALAILGIGLLIIGAALPIGVRYTQQSVNMTTGQAAAEYALDVIEQNVALWTKVVDVGTHLLKAEPGLFQPRWPTDTPPYKTGDFDSKYEPVIKVRPLFMQNIIAITSASASRGDEFFVPNDPTIRGQVLGEEAIRNWLGMPTNFPGSVNDTRECDASLSGTNPAGPWLRPAIASVGTVYPPITPDKPFLTTDYLRDAPSHYTRTFVHGPNTTPPGAETSKVLDKRVVWTAFYRRVEYPGNPPAPADPTLYEIIAVATWLPSANHRFPLQDPESGGSGGTTAYDGRGATGYLANYDCVAPVPWLVTFDPQPNPLALPAPPGSPPFDTNGFPNMGTAAQPATLAFRCKASYDGLFPVGTIFIPARNDQAPDGVSNPAYRVGFAPPAPTNLPIYEVVGRPDETTVVVKYNGYYPRKGQTTPTAAEWPVWVIPPAIQEVLPGNPPTPVFEKRSPILAVVRRYVHLREIP